MSPADRAGLRRAALRVAVAAGIGLLCLAWLRELGGPAALRARLGLWAPPFSLLLHVAIEMTPFGNVIPFGVANGSVYGVWGGALLSWLGWMAAALLQHALVQTRDCEPGIERAPPPRRAWPAWLPVEHPAVLIIGRWLPGGAYFVNLGASALGVSLIRQLACAAIAGAPAAVALAALGEQIAR